MCYRYMGSGREIKKEMSRENPNSQISGHGSENGNGNGWHFRYIKCQ